MEEQVERLQRQLNILSEQLSNLEEDINQEKFVYETRNKNKINLITNVDKLVNALIELNDYRRSIYKGYNIDDTMHMTKGHMHKYESGDYIEVPIEIKGSISVIDENLILEKIQRLFEENDLYNILSEYL